MDIENLKKEKSKNGFLSIGVLAFVVAGIFISLSESVNAYNVEGGGVCNCSSCDDCTDALKNNWHIIDNVRIITEGTPVTSRLDWESKAAMPTPRSWTGAIVYNGKIYVVGGCSSPTDGQQFYNAVTTLEVYDPSTDSWTKLTPMPIPAVGPAVAAMNGKIYVFGGFNRNTWSANSNVQIYDISTNTWTKGKDMPTPRSWTRALVLDGKIYVIGGVGHGYRRDVEAYDPIKDTWEIKSPILPRERYLHAAIAYNGKIYVIGGDSWQYGYDEVWDDIQEYDPITDAWVKKSPMPAPASGLDAVVVDGKIYVFGGLPKPNTAWIYDIQSDKWEEIQSNHSPKSSSASFVFWNGYIFRFGGGGWGPTLNIVESAKIAPVYTCTFTKLEPSTIETSESTYNATLTATGSNFYNVDEITFTWSGPDNDTKTWKKGDSNWNAGVTIISNTSMILRLRVLYQQSGTQTKTWTWTVTLKDSTGATASKQFTVTYKPNVLLTLYVHEGSVSGPLLSGVRVTGYDGAGKPFDKTTDGGYVVITGSPGMWNFTASKSGYKTNSWSQSITTTCEKPAYLEKEATSAPSPSTREEYISKLIQQEMIEQHIVRIKDQRYRIVTLGKYIDPVTLECKDSSKIVKVYVNDDYSPIKDPTTLRKIRIIDEANRYLTNGGSAEGIKARINDIKTRERLYKLIKFDEFLLKELSKSAVIAFGAYLSSGMTLMKDISSVDSDVFKELLLDPNMALEANMDMNLKEAKKEYEIALKIAEDHPAGTIRNDYDGAYNYLSHYLNAENHEMLGFAYMDCLQNLNKNTEDDLKEMGKEIVKQLVDKYVKGGEIAVDAINRIEKISDFAKLMKERYPKLEKDMEAYFTRDFKITELLSSSVLNPAATYSYCLATGVNEPQDSNYNEVDINIPQYRLVGISVASPVELRVYDSKNQTTGLVNGEIKEEIPGSIYDNKTKTVVILNATDSYRYEVVGTDNGTYGLEVTSAESGKVNTLTTSGIPTLASSIHQYTVNWSTLVASGGKEGITMQIDSNGDGTFENVTNPFVEKTEAAPPVLVIKPENVIDDLYINSSSVLLYGVYHINDSNGDGVIVINASNIILDCNYTHFIGNGSGYGIYNPGFHNVTIKHCWIENYTYGIYTKNANGTKILNNEISNNHIGLYSENSPFTINLNILYKNVNSDFNSSHYDKCTCNSCSECTEKLNSPFCTEVYLTADITNQAGTCINNPENFNNKIFDCQGHTIEGNGYDTGIYIYEKTGNTIKNCIITKFEDGIYLDYSSDNTVINNTANNNSYGIYLDYSSNNTITNNTANNNSYYYSYYYRYGGIGIYLFSSSNNTITNNTVNSNNWNGIYLYYSSNNIMRNNTMNNNAYNFGIHGGKISHFYQDIDTSNLVDNKPIYYWTNEKNAPNNCKNAEINELNNTGFVALVSCDNITVKNLNLTKNDRGILIVNTTNSKILNNTANNNEYGIYLYYYSNDNTITNNTANNNQKGIYLDYSSNNTITNNTANNNQKGIYLDYSSNNIMRNNTMNNNTYNFNIDGWKISDFYQDIDTSNKVDGKPIYYWTNEKNAPNNCKNAEINESSNAGFVALVSCDNITVKNLNLTKNSHGILLVNTTNSKILNNTANNNSNCGIYLSSSSNNNLITNNTANNNYYGISLSSSSNYNTITNNTANNNQDGISLYSSSNYNTITNNTANNNWHGIYLYFSSNNTITSNTANNNSYYGILLDSSSNNTITSNTANNNSNYGILLDSSSNNTITNNTANNNNQYGIYLYFSSSNNTITSNTANNNSIYGIYLYDSSNYNTITNNTANNNKYYGIAVYSSSNYNTITSNTANNNARIGILLYFSSNYNTITNNTANNNSYGIYLYFSSDNIITNNTANNNNGDGIYLFGNSNFNKILSNKILNNNETGIGMFNCDPQGWCPGGNSNNSIENNEILNNKIGIFSNSSNSTINRNVVCGNTQLDFNSSDWLSSYGSNNTCDKSDGWNDTGKTGCTFSYSSHCNPYDLDNNHVIDIFDVVTGLEYLSGERNLIFNEECSRGIDEKFDFIDLLTLISKMG